MTILLDWVWFLTKVGARNCTGLSGRGPIIKLKRYECRLIAAVHLITVTLTQILIAFGADRKNRTDSVSQ